MEYTIFYKTTELDKWQYRRLNLSYDECEKICNNEKYFEYHIEDLLRYSAFDLHLLTNITYFNGKYYFPQEDIPYPESDSQNIKYINYVVDFEPDCDDICYEKENSILTMNLCFTLFGQKIQMAILPQSCVENFEIFLRELIENTHSVYHNEEYSSFKWLVWEKDSFIRLIHQDYSGNDVKIIFDVCVDKDWFLKVCKQLINCMKNSIMDEEDDLTPIVPI